MSLSPFIKDIHYIVAFAGRIWPIQSFEYVRQQFSLLSESVNSLSARHVALAHFPLTNSLINSTVKTKLRVQWSVSQCSPVDGQIRSECRGGFTAHETKRHKNHVNLIFFTFCRSVYLFEFLHRKSKCLWVPQEWANRMAGTNSILVYPNSKIWSVLNTIPQNPHTHIGGDYNMSRRDVFMWFLCEWKIPICQTAVETRDTGRDRDHQNIRLYFIAKVVLAEFTQTHTCLCVYFCLTLLLVLTQIFW